MPNFSILLAPSEGKKPGGNPFAPDMFDYRSSNTFNYFSELNPDRRRLIDELQQTLETLDDDGLQALFGVKGAHLEEAVAVNSELYDAPLMSALDRYSPGVMYEAMDFAGLPTGAQRRLLENGIILSGLFGLLRPDDLIPNYRLRIDASLPEVGKVGAYWKPRMSPLLNEALRDRFVWDLLPTAHRDAWDDAHTYAERVRMAFYDVRDGERRPVTHHVKPLRGQLVNFIVRETVETLGPLLEWEHPAGYRYDEGASTYDEATRTRVVAFVKDEA
ncbi:MAG: YaaA family protein [Rhodothermales bacterium]|nr:YaaA family protein [Rhodothermales bacterium]